MTSPYVRRRRLAEELRGLREERGLTADELGRRVYQSRTKITRLENAQLRPDLAEIVDLLEALEVTGERHARLFRLAKDAARKGWWDRYSVAMGPRQRLYADLESGAVAIRAYNQTGIPAMLQTPAFIAALIELDRRQGPLAYRPERMTEARLRRQEHLLGPTGPSYEMVLDEIVIFRLGVSPQVMSDQLRHLVGAMSGEPRVSVRVLPTRAHLSGGLLPRSSFFLYDFPDPDDPPMAVIDTVTTDLIHTERNELARYTGHYERLRTAALSPDESVAFLLGAAAELADTTGARP